MFWVFTSVSILLAVSYFGWHSTISTDGFLLRYEQDARVTRKREKWNRKKALVQVSATYPSKWNYFRVARYPSESMPRIASLHMQRHAPRFLVESWAILRPMKVAAYQAPLLAAGSFQAIALMQERVVWCESEGVSILCCPEAILAA